MRKKGSEFSGSELVFIGTAAGMPSTKRGNSCTAYRTMKGTFLFDCGEGSCVKLMHTDGVSIQDVTDIFVTHMHGDHVMGLPPLAALDPQPRGEV